MDSPKTYYPLLDIEKIIPILNKISILGGLREQQLYSIFKLLKKVNYEPNEYIYHRGDEPSHIYIVQYGKVKIVIDENNVSLELITFTTGACFGETAVIGIQPHSTSAVAVEATELIVLERQALLSIFESDKELFSMLILNIAREACRRLHKSDDMLAQFIFSK